MKRKTHRNKNSVGYKSVRLGGKILRSVADKNPLDEVGKIPAHIYDKTVSPQLDKIAFKANGSLGYKRGSNPVWGSIRYTFLRIAIGLLTFGIISGFINLLKI